jgi:murein L,D-transpeptidase YafK
MGSLFPAIGDVRVRLLAPRAMLALGLMAIALALTSCAARIETPAHLRPLSTQSLSLLGHKGMTPNSPIFIRIFKEESELEVWKQRADGRFYHFRTYPVCHWSGDLGPKFRTGDKQAPEGFYSVAKSQMNPNSSFHLSFNLGYPNAFDKAHGRTGDFLMVHGKCKSAGCYAMTDALMEEIYALAREAFDGGQERFYVHAFPFRMTEASLDRQKKNPHYRFWRMLKPAYDHFELTRIPPTVAVCQRRYVVNVEWDGPKPDPNGSCPQFTRPVVEPFVPAPLAVSPRRADTAPPAQPLQTPRRASLLGAASR